MILLTVGTQLPFDRLVRKIDEIAPSLDLPVFAQTGSSGFEPRNMSWAKHLRPAEFEERLRGARLLISHAGIGSVLAAQRNEKPIILFPRRAQFGEHRNDHQLATVRALTGRAGIYIAADEHELEQLIHNSHNLVPCGPIEAERERLRERLVDFISTGR